MVSLNQHKQATRNLVNFLPPDLIDIGDKRDVLSVVKPAAAMWESLGLALEIKPHVLERINVDFVISSYDRLSVTISEWLLGNGGECSWKFLCGALRSPLVERPALAESIEARYLS